MVLEFLYSRVSLGGQSNDKIQESRLISVGYHYLGLSNKKKACNIIADACDYSYKIFGFYQQESWGRWSAGKKSCIFIPDYQFEKGPIHLVLDAHVFREVFNQCRIAISTSTGHRGRVIITKKNIYHVTLRKSLIPRSKRLVVGDYSKISTTQNVSQKSEVPSVSIILLNHEKSHLTNLSSVAAASSGVKVPFEILCADNGSTQKCINELREGEVPIKILELPKNLGFSCANNLAAWEARGEYLLFVNNDAFLDDGAVDEMMGAFQVMPDCRIAGTVLRFPDGTIQEAGATIQSNGHPIRHGRNDPKFKPRKLPRFQSVDYVSGACLMIRKSDFLEMGGFDEKYSPAYYEDTDLCMRSLLYGQKVYLASRANCYHIENATTSTIEQRDWARQTGEKHRKKFLEDWGAYLGSRDPQDLPHYLKQ